MTAAVPAPATLGPRTAALVARIDELDGAVVATADRITAADARTVRTALVGVRERLALGVDHTVVALAGGTGSGKSSLFNALAKLDFADVGVRRPTTSQVAACAWAHDASDLLDWLGVARDRRIDRESALDGESQADLRGLVLLDLPDHDSVEPAHRAVVDRLLPLVDLLVWVVDPQKYADDALHTGYLRHLVGHQAAMLVVVNQMDTVPPGRQADLLRDVARLLEEDGLGDVAVHSVSARTGDGMPALRASLAHAVAGRGVAQTRAAAELDDAAVLLRAHLGDGEPDLSGEARARVVDGLAGSAGLPTIAASLEATAARGGRPGGPAIGPVQPDAVAAVRAAWVAHAGAGLPGPWQEAVATAVPAADLVVDEVDRSLGEIALPPRAARGAAVVRTAAAVCALLALVGAALCVAVVADDGWTGDAVSRALGAVGAAAVAVGLLVWARALHREAARRQATDLVRTARSALDPVVQRLLVDPAATVLADHRTAREAAGRVVPPGSTASARTV